MATRRQRQRSEPGPESARSPSERTAKRPSKRPARQDGPAGRSELQLTKDVLRAILENCSEGLVVVDGGGRIRWVNARTEEIFQYRRGELLGKRVELLIPEQLRDAHVPLREGFSKRPRTRPMGPGACPVGRRRDGTQFTVDVGLSFIEIEEQPYAVAFVTDTTERKQREEAVRQSQERYQALADASFEGIAIHDQGTIVDANEQFVAMLGYELSEVIGKHLSEVLAPASLEEVLERTASGNEEPYEVVGVRKDGATIATEVRAREIHHGGHTVRVGVVRDLTERKRAEKALRESEERFRVSLMHAHVVVFQQDTELRYTWVYNPTSGLAPEDVVGKTDADLYSPEDAARLTETKRRVLESGAGVREETQICVGGHIIWLDRTLEPLHDQTGALVGITGASLDITQRKQAEQELLRAKEELEGKIERTLEGGGAYSLTFRELSVLHLVAEGKTDKEIGAVLGISPLTVGKHVGNILAKMDVASRTEAGTRAIREGLVV